MPSAAAIKKAAYAKRVDELLDNYDTAFLVGADNVGSKQFMDIRAVRGDSMTLVKALTRGARSISVAYRRIARPMTARLDDIARLFFFCARFRLVSSSNVALTERVSLFSQACCPESVVLRARTLSCVSASPTTARRRVTTRG